MFSKRVWRQAQVLIAGALLAVGQRTVERAEHAAEMLAHSPQLVALLTQALPDVMLFAEGILILAR